MTITSFGHSAIQIETGGTTLLFDPFITGNRHAEGVVTPDELAPDVILITHAHGDHWGDTVAIAKRTGALVIANYEITEYAKKQGVAHVHAMNTGGRSDFPWGRVTQTWARHSSSFPDGTYGGNPGGYLLELEDRTIYNAGDTSRFAEMAWLGEDFELDLAFLPVGDTVTMGPEEAVRCVELLEPKLTIPLHYGTFPFLLPGPQRFTDAMAEAGYASRVLKPGAAFEL